MHTYSIKEYESLRNKYWYRLTNGAWNASGINHPQNIGYLMFHIGNLRPNSYEVWEEYFYNKIAGKGKLLEYAKKFKTFVLRDKCITDRFDYASLDLETYYNMVTCRLVYETWLGYFAEVAAGKLLSSCLTEKGYNIKLKPLKPEDDNKYAVDYKLYYADKLICGVQVKSCNYHKSNQDIVKKTISSNEKKNQLFTSLYHVPVHYIYYKCLNYYKHKYKLVDSDASVDAIIQQLKVLSGSLPA